jgi:cardiolipin synthase
MRPQDQAGAAPRREGSDIINLPNIITFLRLCAVPVAVWLVLHAQFLAGFWIFAAAGVSDAVDGWLARRRGPTALGGLMDPVADKALLVCMYVTLAAAGVLPDWLAILVVFRDLVIVGGAVTLRLIGNRMSLRPLRISKLNTALQIVLVAASLLTSGLGLAVPVLIGALVWAVAASTLASGAAYVWKAARG